MITAAFILLGLAAACFAVRLVVGPRLADRVIGLDGLIIVGVCTVALRAMSTGDGSFLPVLVVVTLVGFVGTAASARFIEGHSNLDHVAPDADAGVVDLVEGLPNDSEPDDTEPDDTEPDSAEADS